MRQDLQMISGRRLQHILHRKILRQRYVAALEIRFHVMRRAVSYLHRILFANNLKVA